VPARRTGYIQSVDSDGLLSVARAHDVIIRMAHGVGDFVIESTPLASVARQAPASPRDLASTLAEPLNELYSISAFRTVQQDAAFGVRQLVDIALKGLSPGVNDTATAVTAVDYLAGVLVRLARRRIVTPIRADDGVPRVIACGPTFESLVSTAFDEIRRDAESSPTVLTRLLGALDAIGEQTRDADRRQVLREHVRLVRLAAERGVNAPEDLAALVRHAGDVARRLA
jgi:uncharacterized membrane protein